MRAFNKMKRIKHTTKSKNLHNIFWGSLSSKRTSYPIELHERRIFKSYGCIHEACYFSDETEDRLRKININ